jgi:arginine/lysine/ornithine decarboxylase
MIDFALKVAEGFRGVHSPHTSTSPNYQILAVLVVAKRRGFSWCNDSSVRDEAATRLIIIRCSASTCTA